MLQNDYLAKVRDLINRLESTQAEPVNSAADAVAGASLTARASSSVPWATATRATCSAAPAG